MATFSTDDVRAYLQGWEVEAASAAVSPEELREVNGRLQAFAGEHALRYALTAELFPPATTGARLLEVGSAPYLSSVFLEHRMGFQVTHLNLNHDARLPPPIRLRNGVTGETSTVDSSELNIEFDTLPDPEGTYDVVACCEIIEHLTVDPVHMIGEMHRVLKPGGTLVLTTPNAVSRTNVIRLLRGRNIYDRYPRHSIWGAYGRHNREYTPLELKGLLDTLGFDVTTCRTADIYDHPKALDSLFELAWLSIPMGLRAFFSRRPEARDDMRNDLILIAARKARRFEAAYPDNLFYPGG